MLALKLTPEDSVATLLDEAPKGEAVEVVLKGETVDRFCAKEAIPFGFKVCVSPLKKGDPVVKYSHVIGRATRDIAVGELVHVHNIEGSRGRGDLERRA